MKTIEFHIAFKYILIGLGVVHILVGFGTIIQAVREAITVAELTDPKWKNHEEFTNYKESNSMGKSAIMPFVVGVSCLVLAFIRSFYLIFVLIAVCLIEMFLFFFSAITILGMSTTRFERAEQLRLSNPNDEVYQICGRLESIMTVNKGVILLGVIASLLTETCISWIWKLSRARGLSSGTTSGTGTFTLQ